MAWWGRPRVGWHGPVSLPFSLLAALGGVGGHRWMGEGRRALGRDRFVLANRVVGRTSARGDENLCAGGRVGQLGQVSGDDLDVIYFSSLLAFPPRPRLLAYTSASGIFSNIWKIWYLMSSVSDKVHTLGNNKIRGLFRINSNTNVKTRLFQDFLGPIWADLDVLFFSGPSTTNRRKRSHFCGWFRQPPPASSWGCPGLERGPLALTSPLWNKKKSAVAVFGK